LHQPCEVKFTLADLCALGETIRVTRRALVTQACGYLPIGANGLLVVFDVTERAYAAHVCHVPDSAPPFELGQLHQINAPPTGVSQRWTIAGSLEKASPQCAKVFVFQEDSTFDTPHG
jgi:hypothetical protein